MNGKDIEKKNPKSVFLFSQTKVVALDKNADQLRSLTARAVLSHGHLETKARDLQRQSKLAKVTFL